MANKKESLIISLGGSLIYPPQGLDMNFIKKFKDFILEEAKKRDKIFLICGGGTLARNYVKSAKKISEVSNEEADWLGIYCTRVNAYLIKSILPQSLVYSEILFSPEQEVKTTKKVILAGGYKPGRSTDCMAAELAINNNVKTIINLSNIEFLYNKDPKKYKDAYKIKNITWKDYRKIINSKWEPGANTPFDPTASKLAQKHKLQVFLTKGKPLTNLKDFCKNNKIKGTIID